MVIEPGMHRVGMDGIKLGPQAQTFLDHSIYIKGIQKGVLGNTEAVGLYQHPTI